MPLRRANYSDITQIADILNKAFFDDPLTEYFFPNRREYPEDYLRQNEYDVMASWWKYDRVWIVSYDDAVVTGVVCWARRGKGVKQLWNSPWWDPVPYLAGFLVSKYERKGQSFHNRAVRLPSASDPVPIRKHELGATVGPFIGRFFFEPELSSEHWEVCQLAVHPDYQRKGIGAELVRWGTERAEAENVPCIVISSTGSEKFYQTCGFNIFVECAGTVSTIVNGEIIENPMKRRIATGGNIYKTR